MHFDHTQVAYIDLIRVWTENHEVGVHTSELEQSAIYATGEQRIEAELMLKLFRSRNRSCGAAEVRPIDPPLFRLAKETDQLYHVRKTAPELLDERQMRSDLELLTRINSQIGMGQTYEHLLPPQSE